MADELENETPDMQVDGTIIELAEQYASLEKRVKALNDEKKEIRDNAAKIGISSLAWQIGVKTVKVMDRGERADFQRGYKRVVSVLSERVGDLFPDDVARIKKRKDAAAERARKAAEAANTETPEQQERRLAADTNPRSDPKRGGAGKGKAKKPGKAHVAAAVERAVERSGFTPAEEAEQAEGESALAALMPETGEKMSQSQIAAKKLAEAGMD